MLDGLRKMLPYGGQQDRTDPDVANRYTRAAEKREREAAAALARKKAIREDAERMTPWTLAVTLATLEQGDGVYSLCRVMSPEYAAMADREAELDALIVDLDDEREEAVLTEAMNTYALGKDAERRKPLDAERKDLRERRAMFHTVAKERIDKQLKDAIGEQVQQRNSVLGKAVPFEDKIHSLEKVRGHFGIIGSNTSRVIGVARWLKRA